MNMDEKLDAILHLVTTMQTDIRQLKDGQQNLEDRMQNLENRMQVLEEGQQEMRRSLNTMQDDLRFLVKKTVDNSADIKQLKLVK